MTTGTLYRLAAFTDTPTGGNPAGVWLGDSLPTPDAMRAVAAEVGFSETAFVTPVIGELRQIRFYSPKGEVTFCGHATIAAGVVLGRLEGEGEYFLHTAAGEVRVTVRRAGGLLEAALRSVPTRNEHPADSVIDEALAALSWQHDELDPSIPPAKAYAGAWHLVLAAATRDRLARLAYDFERLKNMMLRENLTTLALVWRERPDLFHARNPFPVGGVVEDPATGAAAAAFGGYLRDAAMIETPVRFTIRQGEEMGRPSRLTVEVPVSGGIVVTGTAVDL